MFALFGFVLEFRKILLVYVIDSQNNNENNDDSDDEMNNPDRVGCFCVTSPEFM